MMVISLNFSLVKANSPVMTVVAAYQNVQTVFKNLYESEYF